MRSTIFILFIFLPVLAFAQHLRSERFTLTNSFPLMFTYGDVDELLAPKTIHNAIELSVKPRSTNCSVFAQVVFLNGNLNNDYTNKLSIKLTNTNSYNSTVNREPVILTSSPVLLFMQPDGDAEQYSFAYNVTLNPFTTFVSTGQANFSIIFTMTHP